MRMRHMMKRKTSHPLSLLLAWVMSIAALMIGASALASAETPAIAVANVPVLDWGVLLTQVVVWIIGALAAIAAWALKKYVYPWFLSAAVPWLQTHNLVAVAEIAVKYAEAELGRFTGEEKWKLAIALMQAKGFNINSQEVTAALKAAWETLDLQQITAGIKNKAADTADAA